MCHFQSLVYNYKVFHEVLFSSKNPHTLRRNLFEVTIICQIFLKRSHSFTHFSYEYSLKKKYLAFFASPKERLKKKKNEKIKKKNGTTKQKVAKGTKNSGEEGERGESEHPMGQQSIDSAVQVFTHRVRGNLFLGVGQTFHRRVVTRAGVIDS